MQTTLLQDLANPLEKTSLLLAVSCPSCDQGYQGSRTRRRGPLRFDLELIDALTLERTMSLGRSDGQEGVPYYASGYFVDRDL